MDNMADIASGQTRPSSKPGTNSNDPLKGGGFSVISQVSKPQGTPSQGNKSFNPNQGASNGI